MTRFQAEVKIFLSDCISSQIISATVVPDFRVDKAAAEVTISILIKKQLMQSILTNQSPRGNGFEMQESLHTICHTD